MTTKALKLILAVAIVICIAAGMTLLDKASNALTVEVKQSSVRVENFRTSVRIHEYLQKSNDKTLKIADSHMNVAVLQELMHRTANQSRSNQQMATINQIKSELENKNTPEPKLVNKWLTGVMFQTLFDQERAYKFSQENMAPAIMITNPKWSIWLFIIAASAMIAAFSLGFVCSQNRQKKLPC